MMTQSFEHLAKAFAHIPIKVNGFYRTVLEPTTCYYGHRDRLTDNCAIVIGLHGSADFHFDQQAAISVYPGKALLGGYNKHLELMTGEEGFEYILIHYMPHSLEEEGAELLTAITELHPNHDPMLQTLVEQLQAASAIPGSMGQLEKKSAFYRLLNFILHAEYRYLNKDIYPMMDETIQYIQTYYMETLTLEGLASRYQMKAKYFSYLFHKYVGVSPIEYLIGYRMDRAHEMLMTHRFSVTEVAHNVGYRDAYYFSRLFKKHKGMPPSKAHV